MPRKRPTSTKTARKPANKAAGQTAKKPAKKPAGRPGGGRPGGGRPGPKRRTAPVVRVPVVELPMLDPERAGRRIERVLVRLRHRSRAGEMAALRCPLDAVAAAIHLHCVSMHGGDDIHRALADRLVCRNTGKTITLRSLNSFLGKARSAYHAEVDREVAQADADAALGDAGDIVEVANIGIVTLGREATRLLNSEEDAFAKMDNTERNLIVRSMIALTEASRTVADARLKNAQTQQINHKLAALIVKAEQSPGGTVSADELKLVFAGAMLEVGLGPRAAAAYLDRAREDDA